MRLAVYGAVSFPTYTFDFSGFADCVHADKCRSRRRCDPQRVQPPCKLLLRLRSLGAIQCLPHGFDELAVTIIHPLRPRPAACLLWTLTCPRD